MTASATEIAFCSFMEGDIAPFYRYLYRDMLLYAFSCLQGQLALMAEDCVQDAVEKAYRRRGDFVSAGQWKAFLFTCIRNEAISLHRSEAAGDRYAEFVESLDDMHEDMLLDYMRRETISLLFEAIDRLPEDMRELLRLSFVEGLRNSEIAARLGVAEITVKKRKSRMIAMLRGSLPDNLWLLTWLLVEGIQR